MASGQSSEGTTRPWQRHAVDVPADEGIVGRWTRDLEDLHTAAVAVEASGRLALADGVSVVVVVRGGDETEQCLRSLAEQTLPRDQFEVIVVAPHETEGIGKLADDLEAEHAGLRVRVVALPGRSGFVPRAAGVMAARRRYTAFVGGADHVAPTYLQVALEHASQRRIVAGQVVDAATGSPVEASGRLTQVAGTVVPSAVAKEVERNAADNGDELVFLLRMVARYRLKPHSIAPDADATYYLAHRVTMLAGRTQDFDLSVVAPMQTIAKLSELEGVCPRDSLALLRDHIRLTAADINTYLRDKPDDHDRVLDVIESYDLDEFPYDVVNRGLARSLAISYCFVPYNDASAVVMAKRIRARRDLVDVVFNTMDKSREVDPSMRRISSPFVENEIAIPTQTYWSSWPRIEDFRRDGMLRIEELERAKGPYTRLYSRVMWPASQFLAASYKLHNPSVTWIAEFSDPVSRDVRGEERSAPIQRGPFLDTVYDELHKRGLPTLDSDNLMEWCEYVAYTLADRLVFTNDNQLEYMLSYCPSPVVASVVREKAVISPHPSLPPRFYAMADHTYPLDDSVVNLAYFGNFYATRGLSDVLDALAGLEDSTRSRLQLHVFTSNGDDLRRHVDQLGIADRVRINPYVRFLAFLNLTTKFECLLVNDALTADSHARNPYLPSKWSDYKGSGRPVWGLIEAGSPLSTHPLTYSTPVGDVAAAQAVLRQLASA